MDQVQAEMVQGQQSMLASAKRTAFYVVVAGIGGVITIGSIVLSSRTPDAIGLFIGAATATIGVGGALKNTIQMIRCLKKKPKGLTLK